MEVAEKKANVTMEEEEAPTVMVVFTMQQAETHYTASWRTRRCMCPCFRC